MDNVETSNVVFNVKENRYGRLTGEFIFQGQNISKADAMASDLNLNKTVIDMGMGEMVVLVASADFFKNSNGLELLQSRYKDLVHLDVQYALYSIEVNNFGSSSEK